MHNRAFHVPYVRSALVIGEAPNPSGVQRRLMPAMIARALCDWKEYLRDPASYAIRLDQLGEAHAARAARLCDGINLLDRCPRPTSWPAKKAKAAARSIILDHVPLVYEDLARPLLIVLAGRRVSNACRAPFGFGQTMPFALHRPETVPGAYVVVLPHPSGKNFWYNAAKNRAQVLKWVRAIGKALL